MKNLGCSAAVVYVLICFACAAGWGMNVYKLTQCDFEAPYKAEAIRGIGVFAAPLGVIVGYIDIEDGKKE